MTACQLAAAYVWIVYTHAKRMAGMVAYGELVSVGQVALVKAARKWRSFRRKNPKAEFGAFAAQAIIWRMKERIIRNKLLVQEPESTHAHSFGFNEYQRKYEGANRWLDLFPDFKPDAESRIILTDPPIGDCSPPFADDDTREHVHGLLNRLPAIERRALMLLYGIGRRCPATKDQIAVVMHVSPQQVRSLIQSGIMRLRWDAVRGRA